MLKLLGKPALETECETVDLPATRVTWLLIYLGYHGDWLTRQGLAFFFRPDADNDDDGSATMRSCRAARV